MWADLYFWEKSRRKLLKYVAVNSRVAKNYKEMYGNNSL